MTTNIRNVNRFFKGDLDLKICALFHDIGKDDVTDKRIIVDNTRMARVKISSHNHELASLLYVDGWRHLFSDLKIDWIKVKQVIRYHILAHEYINGNLTSKKIKKFRSLKFYDDIIKFELCDKTQPE